MRKVLAATWIAVLLAAATVAQANSFVAGAWTANYPSSQSYANAGCMLCHGDSQGGLFNIYGISLAYPSFDASKFALLEGENSDGDPGNASNLAEISAGTQPGWTAGATNCLYDSALNFYGCAFAPPAEIAGDIDPVAGVPLPPSEPGELVPGIPALSGWSVGALTILLALAVAMGRR
jgi:hypothetical protein